MEGALNVTGEEEPGHGLWNWDYLITCFAQERVCVSFGLWLLSFLFWFTSSILHFYLRCKRKSSYEESVFWDIYAFFGSMCNTIGALLSKQLTIQVITGGFTALADIIHFILTLFPVCSSTYRVRSGHRKFSARRKHRASLSALCLLIFMGVGYSSLRSCANLPVQVPHTPQRRLLGTVLQESTDIVGFTLGIIAVFVAWTVRVPVITKVCRGMIFSVIQIWAVLFSAVASLLYAAAIMSHDRHPEYFVKAIPWFLISLGAAALDVALTFLSCMMKNKLVRQMGFVVEAMGTTDTCELLTHDDDDDEVTTKDGHKVPEEQEKSSWMPLHMVANDRAVCNKTPLARYVRLSIEQVQEWDFEDLTSDWKKNAGILYIAPNDSCVMNGYGKEN
ncbi:transmembrane protein 44 isoform X2 [Bombina bombina]|uniref:transmembrane protein 44 isoform X2 n=1 Tax=Bombina bombina TaxID=8345 RepID=UPI00235A5E8A|nr:transmembrane protein 44 isoform X2 [Bombina bombina]